MSRILIAPYVALSDAVRVHKPSHVLSVLSDPVVPTPKGIAPHRHLRISVDDIVEPAEQFVVPARDHIAEILGFGRTWNRKQPFLVHCWAGISRSTAAAYILLNDIHGAGYEEAIAKGLRFHAPHAMPNRLMVRHADELMKRGGRMLRAVESMSESNPATQGEVVGLPVSLEDL
jgi:predicted protein tyrosine phosphatase